VEDVVLLQFLIFSLLIELRESPADNLKMRHHGFTGDK
jgi:hypothetical protein